jgi:hypothetical protein
MELAATEAKSAYADYKNSPFFPQFTDRPYLVDLGWLKRDPAGGLVLANPIYREVLLRVLAQGPQDSLPVRLGDVRQA